MARMRDRGNRRNKKAKVLRFPDLSGVEGKRPLAPEGNYKVRVVEVTSEEGDSGEYFKWVFEKADGKGKGARIYYITSLAAQALWNLRSILDSLGADIPDEDDTEIDPSDFVGMEMMAEVAHEQNEGFRKQARIIDHEPVGGGGDKDDDGDKDDEGDDDDDDKPERKPRRNKTERRNKKKETLDADVIREMDEDELKELIEEHELEVDLDDFPTLKKKKAAVIDAATEADLISE